MSEPLPQDRFWMVWNPAGRVPTVKHFLRADADMEAERLAKANPGHRFFVLKAVGGFVTDAPQVKQIALQKADKVIPF